MLNNEQAINFRTDERVTLELTAKGLKWVEEKEAIEAAKARAYLRWLDSLIEGERVELRRESRGEDHLIPAVVRRNTITKVVVIVECDTLLPGGVRYEAGEPVIVSKNFDILISGARRLAPVGGE